MCIQEKLKMCKFLLEASVQNFFAKIVQSACFCYRLSKELYNVEIQWLEVGLNIDLSGIGKIRHLGSRYKSPAFDHKWRV